MDCILRYPSPLGQITLAGDGKALVGLWFDGQKHDREVLAAEHREADLPIFAEAIRWLDIYFSGHDPGFTPALRLRGTPFRQAVWRELLRIPYGETATYGQIAAAVGLPHAAQAVGGAVGRNPLSLIVPCHRVLGAKGGLTGYAGGLERKEWLLRLEGRGLFASK